MIKIENVETCGWEAAIRGMRNPLNSWDKRDSGYCHKDLARDCVTCVRNGDVNGDACKAGGFDIGPNDLSLMTRLRDAGTDHRKYMRMITVYVDITAPLYWYKEFDTYKVGTVANSCSTMHKITNKEFTLEDFSCEHICLRQSMDVLKNTIDALNVFRGVYLDGGILRHENGNMGCYSKKDKEIWWQMIQLLPSSYNQRRTVMLNYEVLANMYHSRKGHKLDEWREFCEWIKTLPYSELITGEDV